ncbi:type VI secretion system baseplate subunit TssG [Morganella psychrotolerans]|uniref:type VI secretion system baseplate subunit TssG n=1 Tax=Morganella psychrotolerans TaxID=368603 RepID=UPI000B2296AD|nr:type VI secretion system baseplate subunit TssG [Morganella psychrotolerans]
MAADMFVPVAGLSARQDFFELLRRIAQASPGLAADGVTDGENPCRLRIIQTADTSFAPREVADIRQSVNPVSKQTELTIWCRHFGMFAPYGPLPIHITEHARTELLARRSHAFQDFSSLISRRLALFSYRAWSQLHVAAGHDKSSRNAFQQRLDQIAGITPVLSVGQHIHRVRQAFPACYLPGRSILTNLQSVLTHYFSVPVRIQAHQGMWIDDPHNTTNQRMGRLGKTRVGKRFFDIEHSLSVRIGPVGIREYHLFQRDSERLKALVAICNDFVSHRRVLDVKLLIRTSADMAGHMGHSKLGRSGWLKPDGTIRIQSLFTTAA